MKGSKCGCGSRKICPLSFGLGLGITCALAVLIWVLWVTNYGPTHMMTVFNIPVPTWSEGWMHALWCLIKGFVFGFFLALFYDLFSCCCPCCRKCNCTCCCKSEGCKPEDKIRP